MACLESKHPSAMAPAQSKSHIPRFQRSASLRLRGEKPQVGTQSEHLKFDSASIKKPNSTDTKTFSKTSNSFRSPETDAVDFDDAGSLHSGGSCASFISCDINAFNPHPHDHQASSGASVHSLQGPSKKYVLHCQRHIAPSDSKYLTPTQRKDRHIRQLKAALVRATRGFEEREVEIQRLKSEVERLRFSYSQSATSGSQQLCESPTTILEEDADSLDEAAGVSAANIGNGSSHQQKHRNIHPTSLDLTGSGNTQLQCLEDSGILSDLPEQNFFQNLLMSNKNSPVEILAPGSQGLCFASIMRENSNASKETQTDSESEPQKKQSFRKSVVDNISSTLGQNKGLWDLRGDYSFEGDSFSSHQTDLGEMKRKHAQEVQDLKEKHNNRLETLLHKLSDLNTRYFEVRSAYEKSLERIRQLDTQTLELKKEMSSQEEWHSQMYLKMYRKGQEAAKFEHADEVLEFAHKAPKRVSVPELLQQLHQTEHDLEETKQAYRCEMYRHSTTGDNHQAEYTLKFLKDAVFYYLTEKDNKGHLRAIESILGFNEKERATVARSHRQRRSIV